MCPHLHTHLGMWPGLQLPTLTPENAWQGG